MEKKSIEEQEARFNELVQAPPYDVAELSKLIGAVPAQTGSDWVMAALKALADAEDFDGAWALVKDHGALLATKTGAIFVKDTLKRATRDRLLSSFVEAVGFGARQFADSVARLERLLAFRPGVLVLSQAWGLGEIRRLDYFYRKVTVDFRNRKGHQLTFDAACETLEFAPDDHILVLAKNDPDRVRLMIVEQPGEFVKSMLKSFGDMPVTRMEELVGVHGLLKWMEVPETARDRSPAARWKVFWERARADLRKDKLVEIPTRRTEPMHLKTSKEEYGDGWFTAFSQITDPKSILSSVREFQGTNKARSLSDDSRAKLAERLAFALKGARGSDNALYARIAFCIDDLKLDAERVAKARNYLWEEDRYLAAAQTLPARDMANMVRFLTAADPEGSKAKLLQRLPDMGFPLLSATLEEYSVQVDVTEEDGKKVVTRHQMQPDCEEAVAALLRQPHAPATLLTYIIGRYADYAAFTKLPPLVVILTHAIALGEGRQSGETLKMQNVIRRLFADQKWLEGIFAQLPPADKALFFERFQASIAWDPSTHHLIVVRMTHIAPELAARQVAKVEAPKVERITSLRSYAERKAAYQKLINVDMPENTKRIEFARSYGDLSENAEYSYAKDEQRALLQKQALMQEELNTVKATDFAGVVADEVRPGTMVAIATESGEVRTYTVLGEWDNDLDRNIISNRTRLAQNMLGLKPGDSFDLPDAEGGVSRAKVNAVNPLSAEMVEWLQVPAGLSL